MHDSPAHDEAAEERAARTLFFVASASGRVPTAHSDYLLMLHAGAQELTAALGRIRAALAESSSGDVERDVAYLLRAVNWRFHNVACLALLSRPPSSQLLIELWATIERGSWTSPQLAATAALVDSQFDDKALSLISSHATYYKSIVSLEALLRRSQNAAELSTEARTNLAEALSLDLDASREIALERFHEFAVAASAA